MQFQFKFSRLFYLSFFSGISLFVLMLIATFTGKTQLVLLCHSQKSTTGEVSWKETGRDFDKSKAVKFELNVKTYSTVRIDLPEYSKAIDSLQIKPASISDNNYIIDYLSIKKQGFRPFDILLTDLLPLRDIKIISITNVLHFNCTGKDPAFCVKMPHYKHRVDWMLILLYLLISTLISFCLYFCFRFSILKAMSPTTIILVICTLVIIALSLKMASSAGFSASPDEEDHFKASEYFKTHSLTPQKNTNEAVYTYNSLWAYSRAYQLGINYLLSGKFSNLFDWLISSFRSVRLFGVLLLVFVLLLAIRFPKQNALLLPFLITPQVWYIFSYVNDDYFPLFLSFLLLIVTEAGKSNLIKGFFTPRTGLYICSIGILLGLLCLSKRNYLVTLPFYLLYLVSLPLSFSGNFKGDLTNFIQLLKNYLKIPALIIGIALLVVVARQFTLGESKGVVREEVASYYKQIQVNREAFLAKGISGKARFHSYFAMMKPWIKNSYYSYNGVYGFMKYFGSKNFYNVLLTIHIILFLAFLWISLIRKNFEITFWGLFSLASLLVTVFASSYLFSYNYIFQSQGRYLFPSLPYLGFLFYKIDEKFRNQIILPLVVMLFIMGVYSFVFVGCKALCL